MNRERITDNDVSRAQRQFTSALSATLPGREVEVTLHRGNLAYRITNKVIVRVDGRTVAQVWSDGMAGHSGREAYNAFRLMTATLSLLDER